MDFGPNTEIAHVNILAHKGRGLQQGISDLSHGKTTNVLIPEGNEGKADFGDFVVCQGAHENVPSRLKGKLFRHRFMQGYLEGKRERM